MDNLYNSIHERNRNRRTLVSPSDLEEKFLELAETNTREGVETMGLLLGSINGERIKIEQLVLPKQQGTPNEVTMINEVNLDILQVRSGLATLGWIHTHPTQSAFLSSIDIHTHFGMQSLLPEAVAVVCAPRYSTTKWFRLTSKGMKIAENCTFRGFHEHATREKLFEPALDITFDKRHVDTIDLRYRSPGPEPPTGILGSTREVMAATETGTEAPSSLPATVCPVFPSLQRPPAQESVAVAETATTSDPPAEMETGAAAPSRLPATVCPVFPSRQHPTVQESAAAAVTAGTSEPPEEIETGATLLFRLPSTTGGMMATRRELQDPQVSRLERTAGPSRAGAGATEAADRRKAAEVTSPASTRDLEQHRDGLQNEARVPVSKLRRTAVTIEKSRSHLSFISHCLQEGLIPKGFTLNWRCQISDSGEIDAILRRAERDIMMECKQLLNSKIGRLERESLTFSFIR